MTLNSTEKKAVLKRLHRIKGQIAGIERMLEVDRPVAEILQQLKATESGLHQAIYVVLDEQMRKQLAEALVRGLEACPGECENCDRLNILKHEFSKLSLKEVVDSLMQLGASAFSSKASTKLRANRLRTATEIRQKRKLKKGEK